MRRDAYERVGGHAPIRDVTVDDLALARPLKRGGAKVGVGLGPTLCAVRMYEPNVAALRALEKNVLGPLGRFWWAAPALPVAWAALFATAPLAVVVGAVTGDVVVGTGGAALYVAQSASLVLLRPWHRFVPAKLLAFPLAVVVVAWCTTVALRRRAFHGTVVWRGRAVDVRPRSDPPAR